MVVLGVVGGGSMGGGGEDGEGGEVLLFNFALFFLVSRELPSPSSTVGFKVKS